MGTRCLHHTGIQFILLLVCLPGLYAAQARFRPLPGRRNTRESKACVAKGRISSPAFNASLSEPAFSTVALNLRPCILVRTYKGNRNGLVSLLWSLLSSGHPNLRAIVVDTDPEPLPGLGKIVDSVNALSGRPWVNVSPRTHAQDVDGKFSSLGTPDYGYVLTDLVMEDILKGNGNRNGSVSTEVDLIGTAAASAQPCDTLTVTNGDNVYAQQFLVRTLNKIAKGADIVGTNWVSHYDIDAPPRGTSFFYRGDWCGPYRGGGFQEMKVRFQVGCIDLGAAVFRLKPIQEWGLRFYVDDLRANKTVDHLEMSDGRFLELLARLPGVSFAVLHEALFIHN